MLYRNIKIRYLWRNKEIKTRELIKKLLWLGACTFFIAYFFTDNHGCKIAWLSLVVLEGVFTFITSKKQENNNLGNQ